MFYVSREIHTKQCCTVCATFCCHCHYVSRDAFSCLASTTARSRNESGNLPDDSDLVSNAVATSCDPTELTLNMLRNHALKKPKKQEIKKTHTEYLARKYGHQPLRRPYSRRESCNKIAQCSRNITSPRYPHEN